jgi:hypothetical protein
MSNAKTIDADGHIIERTDELRKYLKPPFNPDSAVKTYDIEGAEKKDNGSDCLG